VAFDQWAGELGLGHRQAAKQLHVEPRTLADWEQRWRENHLAAQPLGRPCNRGDPQARNAVIELMRTHGPRTGLPTLRAAFPKLARGELQRLQARYRRIWRIDHRRLAYVLHWHRPGAVWAIDHADPPRPIEGYWKHLLAVRDLASGYQLLWLPVRTESAAETIDAVQGLFFEYGPPLVLKSDNGSAFIAEEIDQFLAHWQVESLFSPARTPSYNGSCEAGNGAMKHRTSYQAIRQGHPNLWTVDDVEAARNLANHCTYPWGWQNLTHAQAWQARSPITPDERAAFGRTLADHRTRARDEQGYPVDTDLSRTAQAQVDRVAIRRALVERGILTFTRRLITPPLPPQKTTRIS
jgi:transposase InsO family protein